jgi:type II secretory pathway pseudopilin PulG
LNKSDKNGFTVVELIVTIGILIVITALILADYPEFSQRMSLKKTSQEIALVVHQAQAYGLGVREFIPGSGVYPGYGIHFDSSSPDSFLLFADLNGNKLYDGDAEKVELFKIKTGEAIYDLCGNEKNTPPGVCSLNTMDIVYFRPAPVVSLRSGAFTYADAEIKIKSQHAGIKEIIIWLSGQISIE